MNAKKRKEWKHIPEDDFESNLVGTIDDAIAYLLKIKSNGGYDHVIEEGIDELILTYSEKESDDAFKTRIDMKNEHF